MPFPGRTLLTCWLAVVLTGTAVDHRHAAVAGHSHGYGWAALRGTSAPDDLPLAHRHFVLLGIEFGAVPAHADGSSSPGTRPAAGEAVPDDGEARGADLTPDQLTPVPDGPAYPAIGPGPDPIRPGSPPPSGCPHLSFTRTGVLRS